MAISAPSLTAPIADPVGGQTLFANRDGVYPMHGTPPQYRFSSVNRIEWFLDKDNVIGTYTGVKQNFGGTTYYETTVFWPHQIRTGPFNAFFTFVTTQETAWVSANDVKITSVEQDAAIDAATTQDNIDKALIIAGGKGPITNVPPKNGAPEPNNYLAIGVVFAFILSIIYFASKKKEKTKNGNK